MNQPICANYSTDAGLKEKGRMWTEAESGVQQWNPVRCFFLKKTFSVFEMEEGATALKAFISFLHGLENGFG